MEYLFKTFFRLLVRLVLMVAGLVFLASLLAAGFLLLLIWLLRALVARLMGRPVSPWTFKVNRQAVWGRFNAAPAQGRPGSSSTPDIIDAEVKEIKDVKFLDR